MGYRKTALALGEYYHIYNRGNSKQKIFKDENDYERFLGLLFACNSSESFKIDNLGKNSLYDISRGEQLVAIGAYCIMPNHFHLLITPIVEKGISLFMQKVTTAYVMYFNKKYQRTGGLFEGRFKAEHAHADEYLKYLFSYIHLNPVKLIEPKWKEQGIQNKSAVIIHLERYAYSSHQDFLGVQRLENVILDRHLFPSYFPNKRSFHNEIFDWISYR